MIKNRFIWRRKHQVFVFKGCGGSSVDIALWFLSTASSLHLWKLIISFQQYFASELYSTFEIILLGKITSLGALHMLLCLTRCPLTKHQACCEMLGTFEETYCVGLAFFLQILFPLQVKLYKTSHSLLVLQRAATCFGQFRLFCRRVWFGLGWATEHRGKCQHC